jgi:hypothetical protein
MGWLSKVFRKTIEIEFQGDDGRLVKRRVLRKEFDALMNKGLVEGKATLLESCTADIIDPKGDRTEEWLIGRDIEKDVYNRFKDENGHIYIMIVYRAGVPDTNVLKKDAWLYAKKTMDNS